MYFASLFVFLVFYLNSKTEDPVKVSSEKTEEEVEMYLMTQTPHLSKQRIEDFRA